MPPVAVDPDEIPGLLDAPAPGSRPWWYRPLAYLSPVLLIATLSVAFRLVPTLSLSPVSATTTAAGGEMVAGIVMSAIVGAVGFGVLVAALWAGPRRVWEFLYRAALDEETLFRLGSEEWTPAQRVSACLRFGVAHLANLVVAIGTLGGLALVGGLFMWIYLREYRKTCSRRRALAASAAFHADYNAAALTIIVAFPVLLALAVVVT